jgi:hypothetical protein
MASSHPRCKPVIRFLCALNRGRNLRQDQPELQQRCSIRVLHHAAAKCHLDHTNAHVHSDAHSFVSSAGWTRRISVLYGKATT